METPVHIALSSVLAAALYPVFKLKAALILIGGVSIDIDHYLWYALKNKQFNPFKCYYYFTVEAEKNKWKDITGILLVFHTLEFMLAMIALSFYSQWALAFTIGLLPHYLLDAIFLLSVPKRLVASPSIILWSIKNKKLKKITFSLRKKLFFPDEIPKV